MYKSFKKIIYVLILSVFVFSHEYAMADISPEAKKKLKTEKLQHFPTNVMDLAQNTISNLSFYTTNYGIFALNMRMLGTQNAGGGYWPRGSQNEYIFGGGIWFAAQKRLHPDSTSKAKLCLISYNPNSAESWMVPGRIYKKGPTPGKIAEYDMGIDNNDAQSYRIYMSTDFNPTDGLAYIAPKESAIWPIWDVSKTDTLKVDRYFGEFIADNADRNDENSTEAKKIAPAIISGEDIFTTYKDTDLGRYEGNESQRRTEGYPLYIQYEQYIYSWGFGDYKDFIFMRYDLVNYSNDTLWDCYLAPVMDVDIGRRAQSSWGASNDRTRYYEEDPSLNLAVQWTNTDHGEKGFGFGYLGFDFLESPSVVTYWKETMVIDTSRDDYGKPEYDKDGKVMWDTSYTRKKDPDQWKDNNGNPKPGMAMTNALRRDKKVYSNKEQLGLVTMKNWNIQQDIKDNQGRYNFLASGDKDGDDGAGDKRFMMSTGPFHVLPTDTFRTVVAIILANTALGGDADGTEADLAELIRKDEFAQGV